MPMYMDIHYAPGVTFDEVAKAHQVDLQVQARHDVEFVKYWVNEKQGKIFCLCHAPSAEAADAVHREGHGGVAARIIEVTPELAEVFMGSAEMNSAGAVLLPDKNERDTATRTVLFTDIVGSTSMTQQMGDETALSLLRVHDQIVRAALAAMSGREVKHTGDGIMAVFYSAASAVRCAMSIQQNVAQHREKNPDQPLKLRIGIAAGEPIDHHDDLFGSTVQLAARLCAHAEPEQTAMSNAVAELCIGKNLPLKDAGHVELKGFNQPIRFHCVAID